MRKIAIQNYMSFSVHITAVQLPPSTLRFIFSRRQVPIPTGDIVAREVILTGQGIVTDPMDKRIYVTFSQKGMGNDVRVSQRKLVDDKGIELIEFTIHGPEVHEDN